MKTSNAQDRIVQAVALRGYLDGWTDDEVALRQLVKLLEEVGEACAAISLPSITGDMLMFVMDAIDLGERARVLFTERLDLFAGVTVNTAVLAHELADLVVPAAVLADSLAVDDMMAKGVRKAEADAARGVRK